MVMVERHCEHVLDTGALGILPEPVVPEPLRPSADAEAAHRAGEEPLWSESWYFDFVDSQQGIGGWVRLGLIPNQHAAWITALLCGPDMPTVAVVDFGVELPHDPGDVRTETSNSRLPPPRRCRTTASGCVAAARHMTTRPRCCGGKPVGRSR